MTDHDDSELDGPLTPEEEARAGLLTEADLHRIDACLLSNTSRKWRKVARVIAQTMGVVGVQFPGIPDAFYSRRIKHLVESGAIESAGNPDRMRHSEIRISGSETRGLSAVGLELRAHPASDE